MIQIHQMQKFQLFQWDGVGDNGIGVAIDMVPSAAELASVKCGSPVKVKLWIPSGPDFTFDA